MIWGNLIHLSFNMWEDWASPVNSWRAYRPRLRWDDAVWNAVRTRMAEAGVNLVVLDLGDGVRYRSHPEIAVEDAWSPARLRDELSRLRDLGMEPIPKLNFATTHDAWLGPYSRCVSTPAYYQACRELVAEVIELFDGPRFFHLGMDEETADLQGAYQYVTVRQGDLYWHDFHYLCQQVEAAGVRAWVWSDAYWGHPEEYVKNVPASVLQSNWYYGAAFEDETGQDQAAVAAYRGLSEHGYDQVPTGSNIARRDNFGRTVEHCRKQIEGSRLLGFLQTPWRPTVEEHRTDHLEAVDAIKEAMP